NLKGPVAAALSKFGIDAATAYRDPEAALTQFIKKFNELPDSAAKNRLEMVLFKDRAGELIPTLKSFGTDVEGLKKKLADMGLVWTKEGADRADEFGDALTQAQQAARGLVNTFGQEVMPEITRDMRDLTSYIAENRDTFREWGAAVGDVVRGARAVMDSEAGAIVGWLARIAAETNPVIMAVREIRAIGAESRKDAPDPALDPFGPGGSMRGGKSATRDGNVPPPPSPPSGGGEDLLIPKAPKRSAGATAAQRAARLALESAQIDLRGAESVYQEGLSIARRALDLNLNDFSDYLRRRRALENERYKSVADAFAAERAAAGGLKAGERVVKLKDIHQREQAAEREHNDRMAQISTDGLLHDLDVQKKVGEAGVRQMLERQQVADADLAKLVAAGTKTNEQAVRERFAALSKVAEAEAGVLQTALFGALGGETFFKSLGSDGAAQLKETISELINNAVNASDAQGLADNYKEIFGKAQNQEAAKEALDAIVEFFLKRKQAFQQGNKDAQDARDTDLGNTQDYARRMSVVSQAVEDLERESQADRISILEHAGVRREKIWKRQLAFDEEGERIASRRRIAELQLLRDAYEKESKYEAHRADLIAGVDRQIEAERRRSGQRQNNIVEDFLVKQNERLKSIAERGVGMIRNALNGLREDSFKGFFKSLAQDFRDLLLQWSEDLLKSQFLKVFRSVYNVPAPGSTQGSAVTGDPNSGSADFLEFFKQLLH
ncbi:MAG: hypothetical protein M3348_05155, partial [Acidobacteriota bacterium]|nr:hypothetical protein [Acidobacteriota bacterium]